MTDPQLAGLSESPLNRRVSNDELARGGVRPSFNTLRFGVLRFCGFPSKLSEKTRHLDPVLKSGPSPMPLRYRTRPVIPGILRKIGERTAYYLMRASSNRRMPQ